VSDELHKPELGYVQQPVPVVEIDNFTAAAVGQARTLPQDYSAALVFSTKYDPPRLPFFLGRRSEQWDERYFDFHRDLPAGVIARALGGTVVWGEERKGQWVAVVRFERGTGTREAQLEPPRDEFGDAARFSIEESLERRESATELAGLQGKSR
jgi:hypothetical protein